MTPKTRFIVSAAALIAPLVALPIWHVLSPKFQEYNDLSKIVRGAGYHEPTLPTRLYGPGTINTWEVRSDGKVVLHPTCTVPHDVVEPLLLKQQTLVISRRFGDHNVFDASSKVVPSLVSATAGEQITEITVSLENMYEVTMSQEHLREVLKQVLKGSCEEVVFINLRAGSKVCQTARTLQADLVYRLSYSKSLSSEQKADLSGQVAGRLGLNINSSHMDELRGNDLYYGVAAYNSCLSLNGEDVDIVVTRSGQPS
jgi:hypothetical protein